MIHPCLCDVCLKSRDIELAIGLAALREELAQAKKELDELKIVMKRNDDFDEDFKEELRRAGFLEAVAFVEAKHGGECVRSGSDRPTFPCSMCGMIKEMREKQVR